MIFSLYPPRPPSSKYKRNRCTWRLLASTKRTQTFRFRKPPPSIYLLLLSPPWPHSKFSKLVVRFFSSSSFSIFFKKKTCTLHAQSHFRLRWCCCCCCCQRWCKRSRRLHGANELDHERNVVVRIVGWVGGMGVARWCRSRRRARWYQDTANGAEARARSDA